MIKTTLTSLFLCACLSGYSQTSSKITPPAQKKAVAIKRPVNLEKPVQTIEPKAPVNKGKQEKAILEEKKK